jgi:hypothetical protein
MLFPVHRRFFSAACGAGRHRHQSAAQAQGKGNLAGIAFPLAIAHLSDQALAIASLLPAALLTGLAVVSPDLAESLLMIPLVLIIFVVFFFLIRMFRGLGAMSRNQPV